MTDKMHPDDRVMVAMLLLEFELVDIAPFNYQHRRVGDPEIRDIAARIVMKGPSGRQEDDLVRRCFNCAPAVLERLMEMGFVNARRMGAPVRQLKEVK